MNLELQTVIDGLRQMSAEDLAVVFGALQQKHGPPSEFYSINDLACRWRCSRGTVYNRLRSSGAQSLDFTTKNQTRSKKVIPRSVVLQIEHRHMKRIS